MLNLDVAKGVFDEHHIHPAFATPIAEYDNVVVLQVMDLLIKVEENLRSGLLIIDDRHPIKSTFDEFTASISKAQNNVKEMINTMFEMKEKGELSDKLDLKRDEGEEYNVRILAYGDPLFDSGISYGTERGFGLRFGMFDCYDKTGLDKFVNLLNERIK